MDLNLYNKLIVKQKVEILEAITNIESKNKYKIFSIDNKELLFAYEQSNFFARVLLKKMRPLFLNIIDNNNNSNKENFIRIEKKFAFLFPEFKIFDSNNQLIGLVKAKLGISSKLEVYDSNNQLIFYVKNKIMHPWTFNIYKNKIEENSLGLISKKWSGVGRETFSDADNFLINFNQIKDDKNKKIILALSLIIDLFAFEN